jgi:hypothetical protein
MGNANDLRIKISAVIDNADAIQYLRKNKCITYRFQFNLLYSSINEKNIRNPRDGYSRKNSQLQEKFLVCLRVQVFYQQGFVMPFLNMFLSREHCTQKAHVLQSDSGPRSENPTCLNPQPAGAQSSRGTFSQLVTGEYFFTSCFLTLHSVLDSGQNLS